MRRHNESGYAFGVGHIGPRKTYLAWEPLPEGSTCTKLHKRPLMSLAPTSGQFALAVLCFPVAPFQLPFIDTRRKNCGAWSSSSRFHRWPRVGKPNDIGEHLAFPKYPTAIIRFKPSDCPQRSR
jgi:hypothetical protein